MGTIIRQAGAPIQDGETASGTEMEAELDTIFTEINGNLDDANIRSGAAIDGSKLATNSVPGAQLAADGVTTAKMAASAVPKGGAFEGTLSAVLTTSATFVDIGGTPDQTLTPGSADDIIMMWYTGQIQANSEVAGSTWTGAFGFSVNGTDTADLLYLTDVDATYFDERPFHLSYSISASDAGWSSGSIVIKPRYRRVSGSGGGAGTAQRWGPGSQSFTVLIVPTK